MTFPYDRARLDELVAEVDSRLAGVDQAAAEASRVESRAPGLSEQDLAAIERHAESPRAPRELKELVARVKAGELSWADIASGRALDDEGVQAAMAASLPELARAHQEIREGHDPEEIIGADRPDDDEEGGSILRRGW
ncbi:hypothetical protein B0I33_1107 [Prauserella shujinwangii]|uniref:Uncharacterized protein n=1 Tax=Prauserella shujinwangii TaxID=1453103 RepID=A0A2T0LNT8_9PSEU|nr:hypothetical protein [Prauserella shujinwangii]PRX44909.1 hypothetical protein B0I33_1107 [Prauserella shujinwangii]